MAKGLGFLSHKCYCVMGKSMFKERKEVKRKFSCCSGTVLIVTRMVTVHQKIRREKKREPFFTVQQLCEQ